MIGDLIENARRLRAAAILRKLDVEQKSKDVKDQKEVLPKDENEGQI